MLRVVAAPVADGEAEARAFLAGDDSAFGAVASANQVAMFRMLRRYAPLPADALDLTQRAFLHALEARRRPPPAEGLPGLRAWLFRIAINLGKNHARDEARWPRAPLEALEDTRAGATPEELHASAEARALTRAAVAALPPRQRDVFALRVDAGLPFAEVARALEITETNAKANFHLAVKRLREAVRAANETEGSTR
ncbi:MAG: sigma-70 family RNA polymerase sigma factor [Myxococcaceae bacterium]|nr:sigma-70 family RNA polymerase sigma factor [Myxococcaceae bacterium]